MDKKISQLTAATTPLTGAEELAIVQSGVTKKATIEDVKGYKVYTALLTQSGGDSGASGYGFSLVVGVTYSIEVNDGSGDFTNVGAPNNNVGTKFVATGTTPSSWGNSGEVELGYNTGAPIATVLENTIGNIYYQYSGTGSYDINTEPEVLFPLGKTTSFISSVGDDLYAAAYVFLRHLAGDRMTILTQGVDMLDANNQLNNTTIEIRVYN